MAHTYTNLLVHGIFSTKDRLPLIESAIKDALLAVIIRYIDTQEEHHRKVDFKEEFLSFLRKHGIEYDERYIWT